MPLTTNKGKLPRHVAIIMDGNGRWAKQRKRPRLFGHRAGAEALKIIINEAIKHNIEVLTVFAFSSENWSRPESEVNGLMGLFSKAFKTYTKDFKKRNIQLRLIGDITQFPESLQKQMKNAVEASKDSTGLTFVIAANYGGQWDILQAIKKTIESKIKPENITEEIFRKKLTLSDLPDPDLMIRTSGESRISNFFLWQLAYTELYFTEVLWPDFNEHEFQKALDFYVKRERRFGQTSEQLC
jgi:undecaprenyl diphosphate synthase